MNYNDIDKSSYNKYTFGKCLKQQRLDKGYSLRNLASTVGISAAYLSDIEKGARNAPVNSHNNILEAFIDCLQIPDEEKMAFYEMADSASGANAFKKYLEENSAALSFLSQAKNQELTSEEWSVLSCCMDELIKKRNCPKNHSKCKVLK